MYMESRDEARAMKSLDNAQKIFDKLSLPIWIEKVASLRMSAE